MRRRVLILLENEPYPYDRRVSQEALALVEAGHAVTVVSPNSPKAPELETVVDGVRVLRFPELPEGRGALGYAREYLLAAVRMRRVLRRLRKERFDAVIVCNPPDFLIQLARPFARRGAGLVFDLHDPSPELFEAIFHRRGLIHRVLVALERSAERTADVVMTVNEPCAELVRGRGGVPADRVFVLVTCPDPRRFYPVEPRPELRRGKEHLVLWLGRMSRKENLPLLIDAAEELVHNQGRDDLAFAIVGYGNVREELEAEIERRGLAEAVFLPGAADGDLLRGWLQTADVCVSLDDHSPMNDRSLMIKVMEYMAMGKAVVQFPLREMQRVCGSATLYAASGDARDLAEKIRELIDDPAYRRQLGEEARALVESDLNWPAQVPTLLAALERAISLRGGKPPPTEQKQAPKREAVLKR
ncbi:MAG TPA: glycosyltransferase family 4 protein [Solirubrobacteraceae bacterium]|nr:glycosyltransferase family 4 protein [Solirubrobacteraceae bacterium]